jgi:hypothetical protein
MKIEHGKTYLDGYGTKCRLTKRPEGHQTIWVFKDQHGNCYKEDGMCFNHPDPYRDTEADLVSEYIVDIPRPDGVKMTLADIEADIEAAQKNYGSLEFCFTWGTVEALVNKIKQLEGV